VTQSVQTDLGRRLPALEGLRAIAVLAVVITHAGFLSGTTGGHTLPGLVARMDFGVAIFFVLSGFLLYLPHARHSLGLGRVPTLRDYAVRRFARIYPAFLLCLVGTFLLVPVARHEPPGDWLATTALVQTVRPSWQIAPLNHLWSLSTEVAFYLLLPLLAWLLRAGGPVDGHGVLRRQALRIGAVALVAWAFRALVGGGHLGSLEALSWLPAHLDWFAAGMLLALLRVGAGQARWSTRVVAIVTDAPVATRCLAAALLGLATTQLAGPYDLRPATGPEDMLKHLLYLVAATCIVAPSAFDGSDAVSRLLSARWVVWCGTISYAVFLWHLPVMFAVQSELDLPLFGGHFWLTVAATLGVTVPIAALSWYLLEHPVLRAAHQLTRRAPDPVPDPAVEQAVAARQG
jgi:peptidoglycan/LPS O-acetylase OafA/YrhL